VSGQPTRPQPSALCSYSRPGCALRPVSRFFAVPVPYGYTRTLVESACSWRWRECGIRRLLAISCEVV
jgi:hypothetical protein